MSATGLAFDKVAAMRMEFDQTYAVVPAVQSVEAIVNLLSIRMSGNPYALRTSDISAFVRMPKTVALPSSVAELEGVAGIRGEVVPIYSLSSFFGYGREENARWCVLCGSEEPVGFAFSDFEGYVRAPRSKFCAASQENATGELIQHVIRTGEIIRTIISLPSIVEMIRRRSAKKMISEER